MFSNNICLCNEASFSKLNVKFCCYSEIFQRMEHLFKGWWHVEWLNQNDLLSHPTVHVALIILQKIPSLLCCLDIHFAIVYLTSDLLGHKGLTLFYPTNIGFWRSELLNIYCCPSWCTNGYVLRRKKNNSSPSTHPHINLSYRQKQRTVLFCSWECILDFASSHFARKNCLLIHSYWLLAHCHLPFHSHYLSCQYFGKLVWKDLGT